MTAIAGLWRWGNGNHISRDCDRMLGALAIHGVDGERQAVLDGVAAGRCMTRLLPEDVFDLGPVCAHNCLLVADVRLDNRDELGDALGLSREWAARSADSAILFAALDRWHDQTPERLVGDYAFALWDGRKQRLLLARDPLGQRALHIHRARDFFAFASMPKGLYALPEIPYAPDLTRVESRLAQAPIRGNRSFYAGIERIEPGHLMVVTRDGAHAHRHWRPQRQTLKLKRAQDYADALCEVLDRAVTARLRGVGDVAAQLSGGLDSTSVTASAARLQAARARRVWAFTAAPRVGYQDPTKNAFGDESAHAAAVADLYGNLDHVILRPSGRSPFDDFDANIRLYDKPVLNPYNAIWMHGIYAAARARRNRVMLVGDVGNSTISYNGKVLFAETFARGRFLHWAREGAALTRQGWGGWRSIMRDTFGHRLPRGLLSPLRHSNTAAIVASLRRAPVPESHVSRFHRLWRAAERQPSDAWRHRVAWLQQFDFGNENQAALAGWGIDRRDPTADRRVIEFCLSVPTEQFLRRGVPSSLLRRAMNDRLPQVVLQERRKGQQAVDWYESVPVARGRMLAEIKRMAACAPTADCINLTGLRAAVDDWSANGTEKPETVQLYRNLLLRTVSAGHFMRHVHAGHR